MKGIKCEEIENTIRNYARNRNLKVEKVEKEEKEENQSLTNNNNKTIDLNLMALNDLALIESSINDYYTFTFDHLSDNEYFKQFEK
jgi:hypothetical protein